MVRGGQLCVGVFGEALERRRVSGAGDEGTLGAKGDGGRNSAADEVPMGAEGGGEVEPLEADVEESFG